MLDGLTFVAALGGVWLFLTAINDSIELEKIKTEERRDKIRKRVYAEKRKEQAIKVNRRNLWAEVTGYEDYLDR